MKNKDPNMIYKKLKINNIDCKLLENKDNDFGGNATICFYVDESGYEYAVKFLKNKYKTKNNPRYIRFINEIRFLIENKDIDGIVPIVDYKYSIDDNVNKKTEIWYAMPFCDKFNYNGNINKIIKDFIDLAKTLKKLHIKNKYHRDIKPENLLYYKGRLCLSDFGLLFDDNNTNNRITRAGEKIGPYKILPPELLSSNINMKIDYSKSDIYLLAKTLWIAITKKNDGFLGEYNRKLNQIYLDREKYGVYTFEPLHLLMEGSTKYYFGDRITIDEFISYLEIQESIINNMASKDISNKYKYEEDIKYLKANNNEELRQYTDIKVCDEMLSIFHDRKDIVLNINNKEILIIIKNQSFNHREFIINCEIMNISIKIHFCFNVVTIDKSNKTIIKTGVFNNINKIEKLVLDSYFIPEEGKDYYIENCTIETK